MKNLILWMKYTLVVILSMYLQSCKKHHDTPYKEVSKDLQLSITSRVPHDLKADATPAEVAVFAWKEFFALNWQSSFSDDNKRTTPDTDWSLSTSDQPELAVWETYVHRIELRPGNGQRTADLNSGKPNYTFKPAVSDTVVKTTVRTSQIGGTISEESINNYWNILDEDNEIGSAYLFSNKDEHEVLYMAKSNLSEYNYLKDNFPTDTSLKNASQTPYTSLSSTQMCASDSLTQVNKICLPCGVDDGDEGAIEIKLAFVELTPNDDASRFITKQAISYSKLTIDGKLTFVPKRSNFGLIGMHIIHKTKNHPAFVFASWEQVDVRNNNYQTIGISSEMVNDTTYTDVDPRRLNPVVERVIPETIQAVNKQVKSLILSKNQNSKLQYYQLIGAQSQPIDYEDRNGDNNYFMANYVIESDLMLTNFHGSFADPFDKTIQNVSYDNNKFNMGGCMGCHGQAQQGGTDFSFLLDFVGKPVVTPDVYQTYDEAYSSVNQ